MDPQLARTLFYTAFWGLVLMAALLPIFLYWKFGFGKPKNLHRIAAHLAGQGFTLTAGKRSLRLRMNTDGALYTIRYIDSDDQIFETIASITHDAGVFIGEPKPLTPTEAAQAIQAPADDYNPFSSPTAAATLDVGTQWQRLHRLQEENARLKLELARLQSGSDSQGNPASS